MPSQLANANFFYKFYQFLKSVRFRFNKNEHASSNAHLQSLSKLGDFMWPYRVFVVLLYKIPKTLHLKAEIEQKDNYMLFCITFTGMYKFSKL